jgi:DNA-binding response OmpR family regulator
MTKESCPRCVLVVEDDLAIADAVRDAITKEGYEVLVAGDGQTAIELLATAPHPVLVLADLIMPGLDARALLAGMTAEDRLATLPIVMFTADPHAALGLVLPILKKPSSIDALLSVVREHCCRGASGAGDPDDKSPSATMQ